MSDRGPIRHSLSFGTPNAPVAKGRLHTIGLRVSARRDLDVRRLPNMAVVVEDARTSHRPVDVLTISLHPLNGPPAFLHRSLWRGLGSRRGPRVRN